LNEERKSRRGRDLERFASRQTNMETEDVEERSASRRRRSSSARGCTVKPVVLIAGAVVLILLTAIVTYMVSYRKVEAEFIYSRQPVYVEEGEAMETLRTSLESGNSVTTSLRKSFKDYMVVYKASKYNFIPINYELKMHDRSAENVKVVANEEWEYRVNGKTVSYKGIDVSSHQGDIDWQQVAGDKVKFAMLRAVYRGYESGKVVVDDSFAVNAKYATENGIAIGAYLFSQAIDEKEIDEEVDTLLETIKPYDVKCPVVMDIELTEGGTGRADGLSVQERTDLAKRFCERVKAAGYTPMLYYNFETAMTLIDIAQLEDYQKWFATYTMEFYYPYYYSIWQYSNKGTVKGINGDVDMDMSFEKYW